MVGLLELLSFPLGLAGRVFVKVVVDAWITGQVVDAMHPLVLHHQFSWRRHCSCGSICQRILASYVNLLDNFGKDVTFFICLKLDHLHNLLLGYQLLLRILLTEADELIAIPWSRELLFFTARQGFPQF
jgi:hypothetical protein